MRRTALGFICGLASLLMASPAYAGNHKVCIVWNWLGGWEDLQMSPLGLPGYPYQE